MIPLATFKFELIWHDQNSFRWSLLLHFPQVIFLWCQTQLLLSGTHRDCKWIAAMKYLKDFHNYKMCFFWGEQNHLKALDIQWFWCCTVRSRQITHEIYIDQSSEKISPRLFAPRIVQPSRPLAAFHWHLSPSGFFTKYRFGDAFTTKETEVMSRIGSSPASPGAVWPKPERKKTQIGEGSVSCSVWDL